MGIYDDFPSRTKILRVRDIEIIKGLVHKVDAALENKREILKHLSTNRTYFGNTASIDHLCGGVMLGSLPISECMEREAVFKLQEDFREQVLKEIDKFIDKNIEILKKEYNVLYEPKEVRGGHSW